MSARARNARRSRRGDIKLPEVLEANSSQSPVTDGGQGLIGL